MIVEFKDVSHLVPAYIFNEFGQLTGYYVYRDKIVCESDKGRLKIWLNQEAFEMKDPDRLICDYDEALLRDLSTDREV